MLSNPKKLFLSLLLLVLTPLALQSLAKIAGKPVSPVEFKHMRISDAWTKYDGVLTWGKGQCLAILDDGCDLNAPEWQANLPWGKKVVAG